MHEMKTRGRRLGLLAVLAASAVAAGACSRAGASPTVSDTTGGNSGSGAAGRSSVSIVSPPPSPGGGATAAVNGIYRWTISKDQGLAQSPRPDDIAEYPLLITVTLKGSNSGTFAVAVVGSSSELRYGDSGTYTVTGNRMTFQGLNGPPVTFTFSADPAGNLTVSAVEGTDTPEDARIWMVVPWTKIQ
jgi:hypothetical protein